MPLTRRPPTEVVPTGDAEALVGIDVELDVAEESSHETVRPPAPSAPEDANDFIDGAAALRSAKTAASLGRAPTAAETAKMPPFELARMLARVTDDDDG